MSKQECLQEEGDKNHLWAILACSNGGVARTHFCPAPDRVAVIGPSSRLLGTPSGHMSRFAVVAHVHGEMEWKSYDAQEVMVAAVEVRRGSSARADMHEGVDPNPVCSGCMGEALGKQGDRVSMR